MTPQSPGAVVLVRPGRFLPNPLTARDNAFQRRADRGPDQIAEDAYREVTEAAWMLSSAGVTVHLFDDAEATRPDAVFPNNWFSTHPDGRIALYPMYAPNRRTERRSDIIDLLKHRYRVQHVLDYSGVEHDEVFLEGTGAMVLDHAARLAFTARSRRADPALLERFCADFGYTPVLFDAVGPRGIPVYHTNVMMAVGTDIALAGLDLIVDPDRRSHVAELLTDGERRTVIPLRTEQIAAFAGNVLEVTGTGDRRLLAMSTTAYRSLDAEQIRAIEACADILPLPAPTIELAGGSVRCMLAGIHLTPRTAPTGAPAAPTPNGVKRERVTVRRRTQRALLSL